MSVRAVIFDFNGILADDDPVHMKALKKVANEEGLDFTEAEYLETYLPLNDWDCFRILWKSSGLALGEEKIAELIRRKGVYYFEAIANHPVLFGGAESAILAARRRGPVAIASGARAVEIRHILGSANLLQHFAVIVAAEDVRRGKPDPEPFRLAYERLAMQNAGLRASDCLAVEDAIGGIQSAREAGLPCLGVAHSYPRARLQQETEWVIDSISDFAAWLEES
jgi:HAD superfamily hydrolase (TIGR01509 family)